MAWRYTQGHKENNENFKATNFSTAAGPLQLRIYNILDIGSICSSD